MSVMMMMIIVILTLIIIMIIFYDPNKSDALTKVLILVKTPIK